MKKILLLVLLGVSGTFLIATSKVQCEPLNKTLSGKRKALISKCKVECAKLKKTSKVSCRNTTINGKIKKTRNECFCLCCTK